VRVALVGPGRLGRTLHHLLAAAGDPPALVGRGEPVPPCDLAVLCVPDRAVAAVAAALPPGPIVLHTAGALGLEVLAPHAERGSLHPLMTFPGPEVAVPAPRSVPAAVAGTPAALSAARALCERLGFRSFLVPGDRRLYHAAAVLSGNLATLLATEGARLLRAAGVEDPEAREVLLPLVHQSVANSVHGLRAALTGPIARGDGATLAAHVRAMREAGLSEIADTYEALVAHAGRALVTDDPT
jgi:predicted short-subunit dehydrogenase-like oxidoreductase (DUF2520 family)